MIANAGNIWVRVAAFASVVLILAFNVEQVSVSYAAMTNDTRAQMAQWIRGNLSPGSVIAQNQIAGMLDRRFVPPRSRHGGG